MLARSWRAYSSGPVVSIWFQPEYPEAARQDPRFARAAISRPWASLWALFGIEPTKSYPYVLGMAWPAIGALVMRRIALAGTGHGETTVLGRGRW